jgi:hypothetical protein
VAEKSKTIENKNTAEQWLKLEENWSWNNVIEFRVQKLKLQGKKTKRSHAYNLNFRNKIKQIVRKAPASTSNKHLHLDSIKLMKMFKNTSITTMYGPRIPQHILLWEIKIMKNKIYIKSSRSSGQRKFQLFGSGISWIQVQIHSTVIRSNTAQVAKGP